MPWSLQRINDGGVSSGPGAVEDIKCELFVCAYNDQHHFAYLDTNGNIHDSWYNGSRGRWELQQINRGTGLGVPGRYVATDGPAAAGDLFVSVYKGQQHFTYRDQNGNLQDAWHDWSTGLWNLQQINDANGAGASDSSTYIATPAATAPAAGGVFVSPFNDQHHFAYLDADGVIQDCWHDGSTGKWNLQQINRGTGPAAAGDLFVSVYKGQQHFTYRDQNGNLQDAWHDWSTGLWNLQQINDANGAGASDSSTYIATPAATAPAAGGVFVSPFNDQHHFAYLDADGVIQDCWHDGSTGKWNLQQINRGTGPTVPGRYPATDGPAVAGHLFVCAYNDQQHFSYVDSNGNIQDCWYDASTGKWNLQRINRGSTPTVPGEYVATNGPAVVGDLFVSVYSGQQHFTYRDAEANIWDSWWSVPEMATRVVETKLPNGTMALVQAADHDEGGRHADKAGRNDVFDFKNVSGTLEGVAEAVRAGLATVMPSKTTVELGIQLAIKNGKLTGLIVEGKAEASLTVTLEWDKDSSADHSEQPTTPTPEAEPNSSAG